MVHIKAKKIMPSTHVFFYIKCGRVRLYMHTSAKVQQFVKNNIINR